MTTKRRKDVDVSVGEAGVDTTPKGPAATGEPFDDEVVASGSSPVVIWLVVKLSSRGCSCTGEDDKDLMHAGAFPLATSRWQACPAITCEGLATARRGPSSSEAAGVANSIRAEVE